MKSSRIILVSGAAVLVVSIIGVSAFFMTRKPASAPHDPAMFTLIDQQIEINKCDIVQSSLAKLAASSEAQSNTNLQGEIAYRQGDCAFRQMKYSDAVGYLENAIKLLDGSNPVIKTKAEKLLQKAKGEQTNQERRAARLNGTPYSQHAHADGDIH